MKKHLMISAFLAATLTSGAALSMEHKKARVWGEDQSVADGTVTVKKVVAQSNGWLVVHRTDEGGKPGPVVAHAPLWEGQNMDVAAILTEEVESGDMLMLMLHNEEGGMKTGIFEYTLGAKEDGPIKKDGKLVMKTITAK